MKPQNKVTIFMLVMIVMLSIYYFAMPGKDDPIDKGTDDDVESVYAPIREAKDNARDAMIQDLYDLIGTDVNPDQVNKALLAIDELRALTQNETILEAELISAGFIDVYVEGNTKNEVLVYLYTNELSQEEAMLVMDSAKLRFGLDVKVQTRIGIETN